MNKINETVQFLKTKFTQKPKIAIILGTGLNSLGDLLSEKIIIPYPAIPHFPISTAPSHKGQLIYGTFAKQSILIMQGRFHFYEGYSMQEITYPIRVFQRLGIELLIVTNAAGSLNETMQPGQIVLLQDHINFIGTNPLIGKNVEEMGERFPSLHQTYNQKYRNAMKFVAGKHHINVKEGTYLAVSGPSLETRSECLMFQKWGADLVGMSTVPEVIVATHCGLQIIGISIVTNLSNIFHSNAHSQEEIQKNAIKAKEDLEIILHDFIANYEEELCQ
jgi:purine-nucleoside phosphorylase